MKPGTTLPDGRTVTGLRCGRCGDLLIRDAAPVGQPANCRSACGYVFDQSELARAKTVLEAYAASHKS